MGPAVQRVLRRLGIAGLVLSGATTLVGLAHTRPARPLLAYVGRALGVGPAGCPLGYDRKATPEERDRGLALFAASHRGESPAPVRPALGFQLGTTTSSDVQSWARENHVTCDPASRSGHDLSCSTIPATALGSGPALAVSTLWLDFDGHGRLVSVIDMRKSDEAATVSEAYTGTRQRVGDQAGKPVSEREDGSAAKLASGALYQASTEYRFTNYYAMVRATNMGHGTYLLTEEYRALVD